MGSDDMLIDRAFVVPSAANARLTAALFIIAPALPALAWRAVVGAE
jgi:hypothetical protein